MPEMAEKDAEHIRLLSIFHYIVGGMGMLFSCFPVFHLIFGVIMLSGGFPAPKEQPAIPHIVGLMFVILPIVFILLGWCLSGCILYTGRMLQKKTAHTFCFVIACIECICFPFGTILGVFTIIVLNRQSVKDMFSQGISEAT